MPKNTVKKLSDYKQDPLNHNKGSEFGGALLEKSLQVNGMGRSILVSSDDVIIAGNKTQAKAGEMGFDKVLEVETDGKTLVVVKRTDIKSGTKEFYDAAMADNLVSKHNFVEDVIATEAIAEAYNVEPYNWGAQDTMQLHQEDGKGSGLQSLMGDEEDEMEEPDEVEAGAADASPAKKREEMLFPVAAMLNSSYKAKWERLKQLEGVTEDGKALEKFIDKLEKL